MERMRHIPHLNYQRAAKLGYAPVQTLIDFPGVESPLTPKPFGERQQRHWDLRREISKEPSGTKRPATASVVEAQSGSRTVRGLGTRALGCGFGNHSFHMRVLGFGLT